MGGLWPRKVVRRDDDYKMAKCDELTKWRWVQDGPRKVTMDLQDGKAPWLARKMGRASCFM
ncbi:hypothetical protein J1N35_038005 [Gossypium stocksii]|uniref:Uncharacterized protein n=1 Tax=Gossypium stocksii TaxID=47602 RepID=A0A9D3ZLG6_9ROSI|nr:hypothetical protein J1N35_038005 [Gossypium stocksii]